MTMFKLVFNMVLDQCVQLAIEISCICIVFCMLFRRVFTIGSLTGILTCFRLVFSIVKNRLARGLSTRFVFSSFRLSLLVATLGFVCLLGGAQGWCCESCAVVCMRAF